MIGRIYKIHSPQLEICYIGSTCNTTRDRFLQHKNSYKRWLNNNHLQPNSIYPFFQKHGIDNFKCVLVKEYEITDKNQLYVYEQLWINKLKKTCVNKAYAFRIPLMEAKHKDWITTRINSKSLSNNKEVDYTATTPDNVRKAKIITISGLTTPDNVRKAINKYQKANKEKIKESKAKYYQENKEAISTAKKLKYQARKTRVQLD